MKAANVANEKALAARQADDDKHAREIAALKAELKAAHDAALTTALSELETVKKDLEGQLEDSHRRKRMLELFKEMDFDNSNTVDLEEFHDVGAEVIELMNDADITRQSASATARQASTLTHGL